MQHHFSLLAICGSGMTQCETPSHKSSVKRPRPFGMLRALASVFAICASGTLMAACQTIGSGTSQVALESLKIVCLSRKDTKETQLAVGENNAALTALGAPKPECKRR